MKRSNALTLFFIALFSLAVSAPAQVKILFDTDLGGDSDDLGALAMLHHFHSRGEVELLGIGSWQLERYSVPAIDAMNRYFGNPDIPIGTRKGELSEIEHYYGKPLVEHYDYELTHADVPSAATLYRRVLADAEDHSVVFVTVGPLGNIMSLLRSPADEISPLNGLELIHRKVSKFVIMGGKYPEGEQEWNFDGGMAGVTEYVVNHLKLPIVFSGYEVGVSIQTGLVFGELPDTHPLHLSQRHYVTQAPWMKPYSKGELIDNSTYDQTAVLYAVRGGTGEYWEEVPGTCVPDANGGNTWIQDPRGPHVYLRLLEDPETMATLIESIMLNDFE